MSELVDSLCEVIPTSEATETPELVPMVELSDYVLRIKKTDTVDKLTKEEQITFQIIKSFLNNPDTVTATMVNPKNTPLQAFLPRRIQDVFEVRRSVKQLKKRIPVLIQFSSSEVGKVLSKADIRKLIPQMVEYFHSNKIYTLEELLVRLSEQIRVRRKLERVMSLSSSIVGQFLVDQSQSVLSLPEYPVRLTLDQVKIGTHASMLSFLEGEDGFFHQVQIGLSDEDKELILTESDEKALAELQLELIIFFAHELGHVIFDEFLKKRIEEMDTGFYSAYRSVLEAVAIFFDVKVNFVLKEVLSKLGQQELAEHIFSRLKKKIYYLSQYDDYGSSSKHTSGFLIARALRKLSLSELSEWFDSIDIEAISALDIDSSEFRDMVQDPLERFPKKS